VLCAPLHRLQRLTRWNDAGSLYIFSLLLLLVVIGMDAGISFRIDNGKPPQKKKVNVKLPKACTRSRMLLAGQFLPYRLSCSSLVTGDVTSTAEPQSRKEALLLV
jgi:hypothetical protein